MTGGRMIVTGRSSPAQDRTISSAIRLLRPSSGTAGVDAGAPAGHGRGQALRLGDVAQRLFGLESPQEGAVARAPDKHANGMPLAGELLRDVRAEEAAGAGDEHSPGVRGFSH